MACGSRVLFGAAFFWAGRVLESPEDVKTSDGWSLRTGGRAWDFERGHKGTLLGLE